MADIARLAGVSTSTVSRALSGSPLVNEETRLRIAQLARSLNYSINVGAQNLRLQQNRTIGVVVPYDTDTRQHLSDPFFLTILGSLADAVTEQGFDMLISRVDAEHLDAAAKMFDSGRVIGIVLIGQWRHHDQLNQLAARKVPIVVWGAQLPRQLYCTVGGDNVEGGRMATEHLLARGRRRIAFLGDTSLPEVAQRYQGHVAALAQHGLAPVAALQIAAPFLPEGGADAVRDLASGGMACDAVFACSDVLAMTAMYALRERGFGVPEDIAVVGYDDIPLAAYCAPPLSTVRQPVDSAGTALVAALLALIEGRASPSQTLPTTLITRASSGAVA